MPRPQHARAAVQRASAPTPTLAGQHVGAAANDPAPVPDRSRSPASNVEQPRVSAWEGDASLEGGAEEDDAADIPEMLSPALELQRELLAAGVLVPTYWSESTLSSSESER